MCNDYRLTVDLDTVAKYFAATNIRLAHPEGIPGTPSDAKTSG